MTGVYYVLTILIWGCTWIAMKHQIGVVPIEVSIAYRFALAGALMFLFLLVTRRLTLIPARHQPFVLLQGLCLYSLNFICIYLASAYIPSGIVSVVFSAAIILNLVNAFVFHHRRPAPRMVAGALLGVVGIAGLFWQTVAAAGFDSNVIKGLLIALLGTWFFSLGNLVSARNHQHGLPLASVNAWAMLYATAVMVLFALVRGSPFNFDPSSTYVGALLYLAIPGTLIGYTAYLTVVNRLGPEKASYITVLFPVVALAISAFVENYRATPMALVGLAAILAGNVLVLLDRNTGTVDLK